MSKKISKHRYLLSIGYPLDLEEGSVDISVDLDPSREIREVEWSDGRSMKIGNSEPVATLEMEEGRDKVQIIFHRSRETHSIFNRPITDLYLYLDEFLEAVEQGRKLLLNEK